MAIDTAAKRLSAMHPRSPWRGPATLPSGAVSQGERQSSAAMYSGILADDPTPPPDFVVAWAVGAINTTIGTP